MWSTKTFIWRQRRCLKQPNKYSAVQCDKGICSTIGLSLRLSFPQHSRTETFLISHRSSFRGYDTGSTSPNKGKLVLNGSCLIVCRAICPAQRGPPIAVSCLPFVQSMDRIGRLVLHAFMASRRSWLICAGGRDIALFSGNARPCRTL